LVADDEGPARDTLGLVPAAPAAAVPDIAGRFTGGLEGPAAGGMARKGVEKGDKTMDNGKLTRVRAMWMELKSLVA
jgi:hypothetical protein